MRIPLPILFIMSVLISQIGYGQTNQDTTKSTGDFAPGKRLNISNIQFEDEPSVQNDALNGYPLYIIDGKPVIKKNQAKESYKPAHTALSSLQPSEIISMKFVSPEKAIVRFGPHGDKGAVLIKTRAGTRRYQPKFTFDGFSGFQWVARRPEVLNGEQFLQIANEAYLNSGQPAPYQASNISLPGTNWQDKIFRMGYLQNYHFSVNSRKRRGTYFLSGSYLRNQSPIVKASREQITLKGSGKWNIGNYLSIGTQGMVSKGLIQGVLFPLDSGINESLISSALFYPSFVSVNSQDIHSEDIQNLNRGLANPLVLAEKRHESFNRTLGLGQLWANGYFPNGLKIEAKWSVDNTNDQRNQFVPAELIRGLSLRNQSVSNLFSFNQSYNGEYKFSELTNNWDPLILNAKLEHQYQNWDFNRQRGNGLVSASEPIANAPILSSYNALNQWHQYSGLIGAKYQYRERYTASVNMRLNVSPQFAPQNKAVFLPSLSLTWSVANERFFRHNLDRVLDDLDLEFSYGLSANEQARIFPQLSNITWNHPGTYQADLLTYAWLADRREDLRWEKTEETNFGVSTSILSNRIRFNVVRYIKNSRDILTLVNDPNLGYEWQNLGQVTNKGWEIGSNFYAGSIAGFTITGSGNITFNKNEVKDLGGLTTRMLPGFLGTGPLAESIMILEPGKPIGNFYGYQTNGLYQLGDSFDLEPEKQPGDIRLVDMNQDGLLNEDDKTVIGNAISNFFYGFSMTFTRKRFEFDFGFKGSYGNDVLNYNLLYGRDAINGGSNLLTIASQRWTPENPNTDIPRPTLNPETRITDRLIEDGSYLRLANATISYTVPTIEAGKAVFKNVTFYVKGQNLLLFTRYSGFDPEVLAYGSLPYAALAIDRGAYPNARSIILGLNLEL